MFENWCYDAPGASVLACPAPPFPKTSQLLWRSWLSQGGALLRKKWGWGLTFSSALGAPDFSRASGALGTLKVGRASSQPWPRLSGTSISCQVGNKQSIYIRLSDQPTGQQAGRYDAH